MKFLTALARFHTHSWGSGFFETLLPPVRRRKPDGQPVSHYCCRIEGLDDTGARQLYMFCSCGRMFWPPTTPMRSTQLFSQIKRILMSLSE
jgi:hypothetical protein